MFLQYRTPGLIFKKTDRGESNQLFTIYARDFGKLEILGKAIRKISSKLRSGAEIFYLSEIEFIQGKTHKTLTDAILIEKFENIRRDTERLNIAYKISDDLDNFVKGQEADEKIWNLLLETLNNLNSLEIRNSELEILYYYFFWNLVSILGYKPELYHCPICQKKLKPGKLYFSEKEGGIICQDCLKSIKTFFEVSPEIVKILRIILDRDWKTLSRLKVKEEYLKLLDKVSQNYSSFILEEKQKIDKLNI